MSAHTPEPWQCLPGRPHTMQHIQTEDGEHIGTFSKRSDMERAAACVNACAGIDDPAQYIAVARGLADDAELLVDANEMLEAGLTDLIASCRKWAPTIDRSRAEAALKKLQEVMANA